MKIFSIGRCREWHIVQFKPQTPATFMGWITIIYLKFLGVPIIMLHRYGVFSRRHGEHFHLIKENALVVKPFTFRKFSRFKLRYIKGNWKWV